MVWTLVGKGAGGVEGASGMGEAGEGDSGESGEAHGVPRAGARSAGLE